MPAQTAANVLDDSSGSVMQPNTSTATANDGMSGVLVRMTPQAFCAGMPVCIRCAGAFSNLGIAWPHVKDEVS